MNDEIAEITADETEQTLLAAILAEPERAAEAYALVKPQHFYRQAHRYIWRAMEALIEGGEDPWLMAVQSKLSEHGALDSLEYEQRSGAGYLQYLAELHSKPYTTDLEATAETIREFYRRRQLHGAHRNAAHRLAEYEYDAEQAIREVTDVAQDQQTDQTSGTPIDEAADEVLDKAERIEEGEGAPHIPTECWPVDEVLDGGLRKQRLYVLASRPKHGKTRLACAMTAALAQRGWTVDWWYTDGGQSDIAMAYLNHLSGVPNTKIREATWSEHEASRVYEARSEFESWDLEIHPVGRPDPHDVAMTARSKAARSANYICVVDYIQNCDAGHSGASADRRNVEDATKTLASIRTDLDDAIVLALAQFNRSADDETIPKARQLKASGQIEQAANDLLVWSRPRFDASEEYSSEQERLQAQRFGILDRQLSKTAPRQMAQVDAQLGRCNFHRYDEANLNLEAGYEPK